MRENSVIVLIGPMGAGKSTVGKVLASILGKQFVDSDEQIEKKAGASIPYIFEAEGEKGFRAGVGENLRHRNRFWALYASSMPLCFVRFSLPQSLRASSLGSREPFSEGRTAYERGEL